MPEPAETIGPTLTALRTSLGLSQLKLAELLCAAAGTPTITRHEVSRWEREERVPGQFWLSWLAVVLDTPVEALEAAAHATSRRSGAVAVIDPHRLWRPPTADELLTTLAYPQPSAVAPMAHTWLAGAPEAPTTRPHGPPTPDGVHPAQLQALRRTDDLVGGADLAERVDDQLRATVAKQRSGAGRELQRHIAGWAQLAGWVHADAGDARRALGAYQVGLRTAAAAGDRLMAAHVLGSISHLRLATGQVGEALLVARTARTGAGHRAPALLRALLLHRIALAAAWAGERRTAHSALAAAERAAQRARPDREPPWLYWLDEAELAAMTGRCLAALGRPLRALPMLREARPHAGPRTTGLDATWLASAYLDLGEVEQACEVARTAWHDVVRAGSVRIAAQLRRLHPRLVRHPDEPAVQRYERWAAQAASYLPTPVRARRPAPVALPATRPDPPSPRQRAAGK